MLLGVFFVVCVFAHAPKAPQTIYDHTAVGITGGTIDGTIIGGTTAAAGTFAGLTATGTVDLSVVTFDALYRRLPIQAIVSTAHPSNTPDTEIIGTYIGLGFDDDNDNALMTFEIPGDWDGASDISFKLYYAFAIAPADGETVKFDISYRARAEHEDIDTGNATTGTVTETISAAAGETAVGYLFENSITLAYQNGDNPISAADLIGISFDRDDAGDTENGEAIVVLFELRYTANKHSQY